MKRSLPYIFILPLITVGLFPAFSRAADFRLPGEYRLRLNSVSSFLIYNDGAESAQNFLWENRLRLSPELRFGENLLLRAEGDFGGNLGDENGFPGEYADWPRDPGVHPDFRQAYVEWKTKVGILRAGQMASSVGMGILSNGGEEKPAGQPDEILPVTFGDKYYGDLSERLLFATKPLLPFSKSLLAEHLITALAFDLVYRDENADLAEGDLAFQAVFLAFLEAEKSRAGLYLAYRNQEDDDGDTLEVVALDLSGALERPLPWRSLRLKVEGELAATLGETSRLRNLSHLDGVSVRGLGAALRGLLRLPYVSSTTGLEFGLAGGDSNLEDGTAYNFKFDPDYNVGLVLFEEVLAGVSAAGAVRAADPDLVGEAKPGVELLPSNGSISNAYYLFLTQSVKPVPRLTAALGLLYARAAGDLLDPYLSLQAGENRNYLDRPAGDKSLGWELDGKVSCEVPQLASFRTEAGVEAGIFLPGRALADPDGNSPDPVFKVRGKITVSW